MSWIYFYPSVTLPRKSSASYLLYAAGFIKSEVLKTLFKYKLNSSQLLRLLWHWQHFNGLLFDVCLLLVVFDVVDTKILWVKVNGAENIIGGRPCLVFNSKIPTCVQIILKLSAWVQIFRSGLAFLQIWVVDFFRVFCFLWPVQRLFCNRSTLYLGNDTTLLLFHGEVDCDCYHPWDCEHYRNNDTSYGATW